MFRIFQTYLFVIIYLLSCLTAGAQNEHLRTETENRPGPVKVVSTDRSGIIIHYQAGDPQIETLTADREKYFRVLIEGHTYTVDKGKPQLPVLTRLIDLTGRSVSGITISNVVSEEYSPGLKSSAGVLFPAQPGETKSIQDVPRGFIRDKMVYESDIPFFHDTVSVKPVGTVRGREIGIIEISPLVYWPKANRFVLINSMDISVEYKEKPGSSFLKGAAVSAVDNFVSKALIDYDPDHVVPGYTLEPAGMIVLSDTIMRPYLQPLIKWKRQKGYRVTELYVDNVELVRSYTDIKDSINRIYNNPPTGMPPPDYLLIAGDINVIPASDVTSRLSDMYYAEFDGNGDYLPDMFFGRLPAGDTTQMKSIVSKILQYEQFAWPDTIVHYKDAMAFTGYDAGHVAEMNGQLNYASLYLNGVNNINEHIIFHSTNDSIRSAGLDSVKTMLNKGVGFVNYTGHGDRYGWLNTGINYSWVDGMTNSGRYPVIISNACQTARWSDPTNFGATWVRSPDKGALAFIGCSMDSYWVEDFYWAVGVSEITSNPSFSNSGAGFYDRLFHTHSEQPSDWYTSLGQILFAGNMAVSASTSTLKKYYWETYNLLGDPSVTPYLGTPSDFIIDIPDTLPSALSSISFNTEPFAYVAISHGDTLWDASFATPNGAVKLDFPAIQKDSCLLVLTGQNKVPLIKTIYFTESDTAWLNINEISVSDPGGNNNGFADYSETVSFNIDLQNAGNAVASGVSLKLESVSQLITIVTDSVVVPDISALSTVNLADLFSVVVADSISDKELVDFQLTLYYNQSREETSFEINIHAPVPDIIGSMVDDFATGNGNGLPEAGESFKLVIRIENNGSSEISGQLTVSSYDPNLTLPGGSFPTGTMNPGSVLEIPVSASLDPGTPEASVISITVLLNCAPYHDSTQLKMITGHTTEDFETENFNSFRWINDNTWPWIISSSDSYSGSFSAMSADITHNQSSTLSLWLNIPETDSVSFWYRVSSEQGYDFFRFLIDSVVYISDAGDPGWKYSKTEVPSGVHLLQWQYMKDGSLSENLDAAMIDYIKFPVQSFHNNDIALTKIISPSEPTKSYESEIVVVELTSLGIDTLENFTLSYRVNDSTPVNQDFFRDIAPGDTVTVSFDQPADLSVSGTYSIEVCLKVPDEFPMNDTIRIKVLSTGIEDIMLSNEDFDIFPNPFNDHISLTSNTFAADPLIEIYSFTGTMVYSLRPGDLYEGSVVTCNPGKLDAGIYFVVVTTPDGKSLYKAIKQK